MLIATIEAKSVGGKSRLDVGAAGRTIRAGLAGNESSSAGLTLPLIRGIHGRECGWPEMAWPGKPGHGPAATHSRTVVFKPFLVIYSHRSRRP